MTLLTLVALLACLDATVASGQRVIEIAGPPVCAGCRIAAEKSLTLRAPTGASPFVLPILVARDGAGRWYVADPRGAQAVAVYDSSGSSVGQLQIPSEAMVSDLLVTAGDTVRVYGYQETVFDPRGARVRTRPALDGRTAVRHAIRLADNRVVLHANVGSADLFGYPYHVIGANGLRERSFGAEPNETALTSSFGTVRSLAPARPNGFWGARMNRYEVALWSADGGLHTVVKRDVDWFRSWEHWDSKWEVTPPPPRLLSVWQDRSERLWVLTSIIAADWKPYAGSGGSARPTTASMINRSCDTMLDVIDLKTGRLLASERFAQAFMAFVGEGYLLEVAVNDINEGLAQLWRLNFIQPGGGR